VPDHRRRAVSPRHRQAARAGDGAPRLGDGHDRSAGCGRWAGRALPQREGAESAGIRRGGGAADQAGRARPAVRAGALPRGERGCARHQGAVPQACRWQGFRRGGRRDDGLRAAQPLQRPSRDRPAPGRRSTRGAGQRRGPHLRVGGFPGPRPQVADGRARRVSRRARHGGVWLRDELDLQPTAPAARGSGRGRSLLRRPAARDARGPGARRGARAFHRVPSGWSMNRILILDYGSQFTQLIARRVRETHVYCEIHPAARGTDLGFVKQFAPKGIILSGGPNSVSDPGAPTADPKLLELGTPILAICYGMQLVAQLAGGKVTPSAQREYGRAEVTVRYATGLFAVAGCTPDWTPGHFIEQEVRRIRELVGETRRAICGLSGGVDSAVAAALVHRAIGDRLTCIFVDHGLLRLNEREQVERTFRA